MNDYEKATAFIQQLQQEGGDVSAVLAAYQALTSTGKTPLGLNQWVLTDKPRMEEFNEDNRIIDAELTKKANIGPLQKHQLPLLSGFTPRPAPYECYYTIDSTNRVQIFFAVLGTVPARGTHFVFAQLPAGFRPQSSLHAAGYSFLPGQTGGTANGIYITGNGALGVQYDRILNQGDEIGTYGSIYYPAAR